MAYDYDAIFLAYKDEPNRVNMIDDDKGCFDPQGNLVGKAQLIFFSNDTSKGSVFKIWNCKNSFRFKRLFKKLK